MAADAMSIRYGTECSGGVADHIRWEKMKTIHNYLGELSTDEVVDMLSQFSKADEFPDLGSIRPGDPATV